MNARRAGCLLIVGAIAAAAGAAGARAADLPVIRGKRAVASVNGEPITLEDLQRQIGALHAGVAEPGASIRRPDPTGVLERVINARLIAQEARRIGLDRQPEVTERLERIRLSLIKSQLVGVQVDGITAGDPREIERLYRDAVRVVAIDSLLFAKEDDAKAFSDAMQSCADFGDRAKKAIAAGTARGGTGMSSMKMSELRPEVAPVVANMQPGGVSGPIRVPEGFTVVGLFEVRYPESPEARRQAEEEALRIRRQARLDEYIATLRRQYTWIDRALLDSLDYESKEPGFDALRKDGRVVARVKGAAPVTVRDLTTAVETTFYHGVEGAIERKRIGTELPQILDRMLLERVTLVEAKRLKIEQGEGFRARLKDQTEGLLFETFVNKVIHPEVKLEESEVRRHYDDHADEYRSPEMIRIEGLAFRRREDAEAALGKLRKGADLQWMRANADGQADRESFPALLQLDGSLVVSSSLPEGLRRAVAGADRGDFRFYAEPKGPSYVLSIRELVPAARQPYEEVRTDVATKIFDRKRQDVLEDWAAKLRAVSQVTVFARGDELGRALGLGSTGKGRPESAPGAAAPGAPPPS